MIINSSQSQISLQSKNHRQAPAVKALRWFWRFSQFYGEYEGRSLKDRQCWIAEQHANKTHPTETH